jgi:hypothetical protein
VSVDHRGRDIRVAQELLHGRCRSPLRADASRMNGEAYAALRVWRFPRPAGLPHRALKRLIAKMMTMGRACSRIRRSLRCGKHVLPAHSRAACGYFLARALGKPDLAVTCARSRSWSWRARRS